MFKTVTWNTASAAERWRFNQKLKKKKRPPARKLHAASSKRQAASLTNTNNRIIKDI